MTLKTNLKSNKIICKILTIVLCFSLCLSVFSFNEIKHNKVHADTQLDIPGFIKTVTPSIVVSGLVMYMTKLGITFVGNMDKVIEYLQTKLQEYGLWTRLIANGIKINLSNKRILLDNTTLGIFNEFVDEYQTENEDNNIHVNTSNITQIDLFDENGTRINFVDYINPNNYTYIYLNNPNFLEINNIYENSENYKSKTDYYWYFANNNYYIKFVINHTLATGYVTSGNGVYSAYWWLKDATHNNTQYTLNVESTIFKQSYSNVYNNMFYTSDGRVDFNRDDIKYLFSIYDNKIFINKIVKVYDNSNNPYFIINPLSHYYYNYGSYYYKLYIPLSSIPFTTITENTDIYNTLADYNNKLSEIADNQESYVMTMNNLQTSYEDNNALMQAILAEIADGKVAVTTQVSNETGMTEQEAQNTNWFTIITTSLSSWFDNLFDNDISISVDSTIENYNEIENDLTNGLDTNINNITIPSINDFGIKFMASSNFIKDNFDSMTLSNPFGSVITFVLVIGIALLIIGRGLL